MALDCKSLSTAVWVYDIDFFCILWANDAAVTLWNAASLEELTQRDFKPDTSDAVRRILLDYRECFEQKKIIRRFWSFFPKGEKVDAFCQMSGHTLEDGRLGLLCEATPINLLDDHFSHDGIAMLSNFDYQGHFISANPPFHEHINSNLSHISELFSDDEQAKEILFNIQRKKQHIEDVLLNTKEGKQWFHFHASVSEVDSESAEIVVQQFNIHERKLEQITLTEQVYSDSLTGLLNRRGLTDALSAFIQQQQPFVVCYLDLDGFKTVNDSMGHACGDEVLKETARRLTCGQLNSGIACRVGGDEFIWALQLSNDTEDILQACQYLLTQMRLPYIDSGNKSLPVSASIGSACFPRDASDLEKLLQYADAAMYKAKAQGKNRYVSYTQGMEHSLHRHSVIARHLAVAIEKKELALHYQPIIDTKTGTIYCFEALLRWQHPSLGLVCAEETVRIAEGIGYISEIGIWVAEQAIKDLNVLKQHYGGALKVSINIAGIHLADPELPQQLTSMLLKEGLVAEDLIVELTESSLLIDIDQEDNCVQRLVETGIGLTVDDFGTGYSSLAYLHQIPVKVVKIDQSFTKKISDNSTTIRCIHHLLSSLNLISLAEGVETMEQSEQLEALGIFLQQGFVLGEPKPLEFYIEQAVPSIAR